MACNRRLKNENKEKKMKRFLMILTALCVIAFNASAQTGFTVGARLGPGFAFNEVDSDVKKLFKGATGKSPKEESNIAFAIALYGNYTIFPKFSIQAELGFMANNGMVLSGTMPDDTDVELRGSFTSLDIPVLARYEFLEDPVSLSVLGGPYLAFPLSKMKGELSMSPDTSGESGSENTKIDGIRFGITLGLAAGYKLGPGSIVADLRFLTDFNPVRTKILGGAKTESVFTRRGINLTVGYEMKL
jgi:hypothetical protein